MLRHTVYAPLLVARVVQRFASWCFLKDVDFYSIVLPYLSLRGFKTTMAATGPYILHKSTQLCFAVRSNVNFEQINPSVLSSKLARKFNFPDGANTLPPRMNLKVLSTAITVVCEKVRLEREKFVLGKQQGKHTRRRRHHRHNELKSRPRETMNNVDDISKHEAKMSSEAVLLGAGGFFWAQERITEHDLIKLVDF